MVKKFCKPVRQLTFAEAVRKLKVSMKPVLVQFRASWCEACQTATPEVEKAACAIQDDVETVAIDIDENPMLTQEFGIETVPTVALIQQGRVLNSIAEATSAKNYKKIANDWLKANGFN